MRIFHLKRLLKIRIKERNRETTQQLSQFLKQILFIQLVVFVQKRELLFIAIMEIPKVMYLKKNINKVN